MKDNNRIILVATLGILLVSVSSSRGKDPLKGLMFPPELLFHKAEEIGLTSDQRHQVETLVKGRHGLMKEKGERLEAVRQKVAAGVEDVPIDVDAANRQFAELLEAESEIKKIQFSTMVEIRNLLTEAQLEKVREIMDNMPPPNPELHRMMETEIKPRMERLQALLRKKAENGDPPTEAIRARMEEVHTSLKGGEVDLAIQLLDDLISELGG